jgi:hypothetical protein
MILLSIPNGQDVTPNDFPGNIKQVALVNDAAPINNSRDASRYPKNGGAIQITVGQRAVLRNSKGKYAVVTVIGIEGEGYYSVKKKALSDVDEVVFKYEILPD